MRLIVCSNSAPDMRFDDAGGAGGERFVSSPGGLVPMMTALLTRTEGRWIFSATGQSGTRPAAPAFPNPGVGLGPVSVAAETFRRFRESYCVKTLLWLFHYLHEPSGGPGSAPDARSSWGAYQAVNQAFADALVAAHENDPGEVVLVNDMHLLLVPGLFGAKVRSRRSRLVYFHHVPWCDPGYFALLPPDQRVAILRSLLHADVVGFHSRRWARAFAACCDRYIPDVRIDGSTVVVGDHYTRLAVSPGTVDAAAITGLRLAAETERSRERLHRRTAGRRMIVRVDRLDLWKNHVRGFAAYERLLEADPALAADVWMCAVASPTRVQTERHVRYQVRCEELVERINRRFGENGEAVSLLYPYDSTDARHLAAAALSLGSVTLVNSTWDGLNLVAKESVLLGGQSRLVLSVNTGVHDQLGPAAFSIDPFDERETAEAMARALAMDEAAAVRARDRAHEVLAGENASTWLRALLDSGDVG